jgi:hypothetical protein
MFSLPDSNRGKVDAKNFNICPSAALSQNMVNLVGSFFYHKKIVERSKFDTLRRQIKVYTRYLVPPSNKSDNHDTT